MRKIKICCIILLFCCILLCSISFAARTSDVHLHNYIVQISRVEPTCTLDGYEELQCYSCPSTYKFTIPKIGHNMVLADDYPPTCTSYGIKVYRCTRCNKYETEPYGEAKGIPHNWYEAERVEPTCYTDGLIVYECHNCDAFECRVYERSTIEHDLELVVEKQPTCTEDGFGYNQCKTDRCG